MVASDSFPAIGRDARRVARLRMDFRIDVSTGVLEAPASRPVKTSDCKMSLVHPSAKDDRKSEHDVRDRCSSGRAIAALRTD